MSRLKKLLPASFKGISFLVEDEIQDESGRRIILHDYPNSSERFVEDQGKIPPSFSITAFVHGPDFIDRADQLERALNEEGKGVLSMPTFGVKKVYSMPYRKNASQKSVGKISFNIPFASGKSISGPSKRPPTAQTVYSQGDTARSAIETTLGDLWEIPSQSSNVVAAQYDLEQFSDAISLMTTVASNAGSIDSMVNLIKVNSPSLVRSGVDLAQAFIGNSTQKTNKGLWQTVSIGLQNGTGIPLLSELTKFGSALSLSLSDIKNASVSDTSSTESTDIPLWNPTTAERIKRNQNRLTLVNAGRVAALVGAYEQIADANYKTEEDIEETRLNIEAEHQRLMRDDTDNRTLIQSQPDVKNAIENIRISALEVLDQKEQSSFSLTTINNNAPVGSFSEAYTLYAEDLKTSENVTNRGIEIRELNPTLPADKLSGEVMVFQS